MSTEGTPDPASSPSDPIGGDAAPSLEPPDAGAPSAGTPDQSSPGSSYPPPGYAQPPYGPPYGQAGPADPGYQQPGYGQQQAYPPPPSGYGYQQPGYPPTYGPAPLSPSDERLWATLAHALPILTSFIAPLIIWLVFRERSRFVDDQGKEALNFQIFLAIAYLVGVVTAFLVIGFFILLAAWILSIVFGIQGAIVAGRGEPYRYPLTWRVIK
jgi:uncharacterized Tic20 family protein